MTTKQQGTPKEFFKVASAARDFVEDWKKGNLRLCIVGTTHATLLDDALKDLSRAHEEALVAAPATRWGDSGPIPGHDFGDEFDAPPPSEVPGDMVESQIKRMVERFLTWRLPEDFNPDGGISFKKTFNEGTAFPMKHEPVGTNLLNAVQATAMVRHMVEGFLAPALAVPMVEDDREFDLEAFHREVWGWLLKRGLVNNGDVECDDFTTVIEEHEQEIEAAATRAAASALTALRAENERLKAELAQLRSDQARWTNAVVVSATGLYPQDYVVRSPCDPPLPKPDVLYIDGAVYRMDPKP
ncbi:hypothetical protein [Mesorhizobium sp.]|uniref:hypothetical protein n=1 Tax=Mesorhizobium sp. TaxID=1871066 RepID=UPI002580799A|nr:hypothetical protein [Mesorhizobium sp.]